MSIPNTVFLDTSVLAGQQYNFSSAAISSFIAAVQGKSIKLLLPAPTSDEVERQIRTRSGEALKILEDARRKAPFLSKWKHWPEKPTESNPKWEVERIAIKEWQSFLSNFDLVKINYDGIKIEKIMQWYNAVRAPFGEGKKRKEFPDAFAIESLALYAAKHSSAIAVVSDDPDFKSACEHFTSLLYFPSLPKLTELLINQYGEVERLRNIIDSEVDTIEDRIFDDIANIGFYTDDSDVEISESEIESLNSMDIQIVSIGGNEFTILFQAEIEARHVFEWRDFYDLDDEGRTYGKESESSKQKTEVSGVAKVLLAPSRNEIDSIPLVELDSEEFQIRAPYIHRHRPY